MTKKTIIITILSTLTIIACEEKGVDDHSRHVRTHTMALPESRAQAHIVEWETFLASGALLMGVTPEHFSKFHRAILAGVFDPNSVLSKADLNRIGASNCTFSPQDATIGVRRFERTLTMAPEFMTMADEYGLHLQDWLLALQREDLLLTLRLMPP